MVAAISVVRNEADVIRETVRHMLRQVDRVVILDNLSTDGTREICEDLGAEVESDTDPRHVQGEKMTVLAQRVIADGADWIVPFDADEVWTPDEAPTIKDALESQPAEVQRARGWIYTHAAVPSGRIRDMKWRWPLAEKTAKIAGRGIPGLVICDGNHEIRYGEDGPCVDGLLKVHHFPYRTAEQMVRKIRAGAEALRRADLGEAIGVHWQSLDSYTDDQLQEEFQKFCFDNTNGHRLVYDPVLDG